MLDLINVSYDTQIPNNVGLSSDKKVLKALEKWHPGYINWWNDLIPQQFHVVNVPCTTLSVWCTPMHTEGTPMHTN